MNTPKRIQRKRTKGWRIPEGAVCVDRPTKWGNPFYGDWLGDAAAEFEKHLTIRRSPSAGWIDLLGYPSDDEIRRELAGRDLVCWCPPDSPCHADVLLRIANEPAGGGE